MAHAIILPKLGQTMEEGAIVRWLKREGESVEKGDILFELETDKANLEVESFFEGTLLRILLPPGRTVPVNTVVGYVGTPGEAVPDTPPVVEGGTRNAERGVRSVEPGSRSAPPSTENRKPETENPPPSTFHPPPSPARLPISPRARALARDKAIDPSGIRGSGPGGRVLERDVLAYLAERRYDDLRVAPAARRLAQQLSVDLLAVRGSGQSGRILVADVQRAHERKPRPLSRARQVIARRLAESKQTIPHFYVTVTADLTDLLRLRTEWKARGTVCGINDFVLAATVAALEAFPAVNSVTDGRTVAWRGDVDLGMAVRVEQGLVVPVIRAAQLLSLFELRDRAQALAERARAGKLTPDEMSGGSFTVSNMGMLRIDVFSAIINPGESAILAVASAREEPAVVAGQIRIRTRMALTLSADHRLIDGATAAEFLNFIRGRLEDVSFWRAQG